MRPEFPIQESVPLDVQELLERCMGNIDLAQRVLSKLQSRFDEDMLDLENALSAENSQLIASIAHRLKGAASNVAAHDLQKCVAMIEESARKNSLKNVAIQLEQLRTEWSRVNTMTLPKKNAD